MKELVKKVSSKSLSLLPMLALLMATASVDTFCFFIAHHPDVPKELLNEVNG